MMSEYELKRLAQLIVIEQANNEEWMLSFARAQSKLQDHGGVMVSAKKAADMLGISVWQLYRIKDDENGNPQFSYTKGCSHSSPLKFNSETLVGEYQKVLEKKKSMQAKMVVMPLRKVL